MIRVTIEMVPGGIEEAKYPMHVIEFWNDIITTADNPKKGTYQYRISRKLQKPFDSVSWHKQGEVNNFPRAAKNSVHLLLAVLKDAYDKKPPKASNVVLS